MNSKENEVVDSEKLNNSRSSKLYEFLNELKSKINHSNLK